jgi:hypothetical protein
MKRSKVDRSRLHALPEAEEKGELKKAVTYDISWLTFSTCDGARPTCSSCQKKGRADCAYNAKGDLRRTSALKQQIGSLQTENNNLRDIITSIVTSTQSSTMQALLALIEQNIRQNGFFRVAELTEVLRSN